MPETMYAIARGNAYLHTDGRFYTAFFNMRGCRAVLYKREHAARKRAKRMNAEVKEIN